MNRSAKHMFYSVQEFEVSIHLIPCTFYISWKSLKAVFQESQIKSMIRCRVQTCSKEVPLIIIMSCNNKSCIEWYCQEWTCYCYAKITWHRGDFRPGVSSHRFPLMALYLFTWYHHKMSCRRESPRREFTPVLVPGREFHSGTKSGRFAYNDTVATRFGVKSVCR